jgi:urease accessory protein
MLKAMFGVPLLGVAVLASAGPAFAHHPTGGATPQSFLHGLLSGLGHPVLGPDHLGFVVGLGILSAFVARGWRLPIAFLGLGAVGTALHLRASEMAPAEALVALSLVAMAAAIWWRGRLGTSGAVLLSGFGGLIHGYVLAESIVGAEPSPLAGYLVGLALCGTALSLGVRAAVLAIGRAQPVLAERGFAAASLALLAVAIGGQLWSI